MTFYVPSVNNVPKLNAQSANVPYIATYTHGAAAGDYAYFSANNGRIMRLGVDGKSIVSQIDGKTGIVTGLCIGDNDRVIAHVAGFGFYYSDDFGVSWQISTGGPALSFNAFAATDGQGNIVAVYGSNATSYRSSDNGATWTNGGALAVLATNASTTLFFRAGFFWLVGGSGAESRLYSTQNGAAWALSATATIPGGTAVAVYYYNNGYYIGNSNGKMYFSRDFTTASLIPLSSTYDLPVSSFNPILFLETTENLYLIRSTTCEILGTNNEFTFVPLGYPSTSGTTGFLMAGAVLNNVPHFIMTSLLYRTLRNE